MISKEILNAYSYVFDNCNLVDRDDNLAREAIQDSIFRLMIMNNKGAPVDKIEKPIAYIIYASKNNARSIRTNKGSNKWLYYDLETTPSDNEFEENKVYYDSIIEYQDLGQILSVDHSIELKDVKEALGEDLEFVMNHLDFSDGSRLRGAKNASHRPKIFDSDAERYRMAYIRKKLRRQFK